MVENSNFYVFLIKYSIKIFTIHSGNSSAELMSLAAGEPNGPFGQLKKKITF
jgi:hypothetical protein